jgi:hypothetical protein
VKSRRSPRSLLAAVAVSAVVLTACGASAPPGRELADEMIDTLERDGRPLSDEVKACMHEVVESFQLTADEAQGFEDLDDAAKKAADGNAQANVVMDRFESELEACNRSS